MTKAIEIIKMPRLHLLNLIKDLNVDQLNKVPAGFNNNIIWNLAHIVAAQQNLCYKRAGLDIVIDERFFTAYLPETKPEKFVDANEVEVIKTLFLLTLDQLEADLQTNRFDNYIPWTSRYGVELSNIDEAVKFVPFHEGLHTGYIWALKRMI
ncbi:DinB family protein [Mucilaginibacter sp. UR6-11]|uniref:DinB family protein n=1 Tax=Mucilaginibacter sp. UR6-11 TaxID=1435644 RepID=UPI001E3CD79F|nr:DinB family protein [Mucilaginibacter sp. UR6-11]MCC8426546.1 DinB family protein [Mucilaginibacter sp. UR6-11]